MRVGHFMKQRLYIGISAPQRIKANSLMCEVDLATDQSVWPVPVDGVTSRKQIYSAMLITATNKDHRTAKWSSGIPSEILGDAAPWQAVVPAMRGLGAMCLDVGCTHDAMRRRSGSDGAARLCSATGR